MTQRPNESLLNAAEARRILSNNLRDSLRLTPRQQAEAAHWAGGPSVNELEVKVIEYRRRIGYVEPIPHR
jgi:hypothetical protein